MCDINKILTYALCKEELIKDSREKEKNDSYYDVWTKNITPTIKTQLKEIFLSRIEKNIIIEDDNYLRFNLGKKTFKRDEIKKCNIIKDILNNSGTPIIFSTVRDPVFENYKGTCECFIHMQKKE